MRDDELDDWSAVLDSKALQSTSSAHHVGQRSLATIAACSAVALLVVIALLIGGFAAQWLTVWSATIIYALIIGLALSFSISLGIWLERR